MRFNFPETLRPPSKSQRLENSPFSPTLLPAQRPFKGHLFHFLVTELSWLTYTELIRIEFLVKASTCIEKNIQNTKLFAL